MIVRMRSRFPKWPDWVAATHKCFKLISKAHLKQADRQAAEVMQRPRALESALEPLIITAV